MSESLLALEMALVEALDAMLEATGDEDIPEETQALVSGYLNAAMEKRDRMASFIESCDARSQAMADEAARILHRKAMLDNATARMRSYVVSVMLATDQKRLPGMVRMLAVQKNPDSVSVEGDVPDKYLLPQKPAPRREPDKRKIKTALEVGEQVPNCRIVPGAWRLVIK